MKTFPQKTVSHQEIATVVEQTADPATTHRVLSAIQDNPLVREKWELLHRIKAADTEILPASADFEAQATRLQADLLKSARAFSHEPATEFAKETHQTKSRASAVREVAQNDAYSPQEPAERVLLVGHHLLTLPILSPANVSPIRDAAPPRQIITTGEGVRIEFHELADGNGIALHRLRIRIDTSDLQSTKHETNRHYNTASVLLENHNQSVLKRNTLTLALNEQGVGFMDFPVGAKEDGFFLSVPQGEYQLAGVTLLSV